MQQALCLAMRRSTPPLPLALLLALLGTFVGGAVAPADDATAFIEVPAGPFVMGADRAHDPQAFDNERWSSTEGEGSVFLPTFYIGRRPVSVSEFAAFAREGKWAVDARALAGQPEQPVGFVSWPDALAYCRWLEKTLKSTPAAPTRYQELLAKGWRVTLPSEAEWEKAARTLDRQQYSWGMTSEWTRSPYQPYPYDSADDRGNLEADALWVIRGGVLEDKTRPPRATARTGADPGARRAFIGFRVALSPPR